MMKTRSALTLIELTVVLCVVVALSSLVLPMCSDQLTGASNTVTQATLSEVRQATIQYWHDTKLVKLDGVTTFADESQRFDTSWLFRNPVTNDCSSTFDPNFRRGWNGPYLSSTLVQASAPILVDAWNHALTIQYVNPNGSLKDVRIVSAGPNGVVNIPANVATAALTTGIIGDDLYVAILLR